MATTTHPKRERNTMAVYYMIAVRNGDDAKWEPCRSLTLLGARREATQRYGEGYTDTKLMVGVGDNVTEPRLVLSTRPAHTRRWTGIPG